MSLDQNKCVRNNYTLLIPLSAVFADIVNKKSFSSSGTNLHKNYTWYILSTC